jgi:hypothetical protein
MFAVLCANVCFCRLAPLNTEFVSNRVGVGCRSSRGGLNTRVGGARFHLTFQRVSVFRCCLRMLRCGRNLCCSAHCGAASVFAAFDSEFSRSWTCARSSSMTRTFKRLRLGLCRARTNEVTKRAHAVVTQDWWCQNHCCCVRLCVACQSLLVYVGRGSRRPRVATFACGLHR